METGRLADKFGFRRLKLRYKIFAPFAVMIVLELALGFGVGRITQNVRGYVKEIERLGLLEMDVSDVTALSIEENVNLMLGGLGALSNGERDAAVLNLRERTAAIEARLRSKFGPFSAFFEAVRDYRVEADYHLELAAVGPYHELSVLHDEQSLDPATTRLLDAGDSVVCVLAARRKRALERLRSAKHWFSVLPSIGPVVESGEELFRTVEHVAIYERIRNLALRAQVQYLNGLRKSADPGADEDNTLEELGELIKRLEKDSPSGRRVERELFDQLTSWRERFREVTEDEASGRRFPYLPVALYRNGVEIFRAMVDHGRSEMAMAVRHADIAGDTAGELMKVYTVILVFFAGLAFVVAIVVSRAVLAQVVRMNEGFDRLGEGDFSVRFDATRGDEIGDLQRGFNRSAMALEARDRNLVEARERLQDLAFRLQHYNENLEAEVEERTRELREANEELRRTDKLKSAFIANMSHELRTPLNSIIGFSKVLLNGIDGPLNERQEQDLSLIHQSGEHLLNLINEILDFARIEAGRLSLFVEELNPSLVAAQVLETVRTGEVAENVDLRLEVAEDVPAIRADRTRLTQILLNLTGNALKFTERGVVTVRVNDEERGGRAGVAFTVADTGEGIPQDDLDRIFNKFHQADNSSTRRHGGSGLGLTIAKELAELHTGDLSVESIVGQGSTFTLWLPVEGPPETNR